MPFWAFQKFYYNAQNKTYINAVLTSGKTLLTLINDILDLSKIESGRLMLQPESVNIANVFADISQIFQVKLLEKNLSLNIEIPSDLPSQLLLDDTRLRQILFNLIGNAIKFTHTGGVNAKVSFANHPTENDSISLSISISDTGIGIPEKAMPKLFNSFFQVESSNTCKYDGTGLGLAISKKLVLMMGGTLTVESKVNVGSTFTLNINKVAISNELRESKPQHHWQDCEIQFQGSKILVVDDVDFNRQLVKSFLNTHNIQVIEAASGKEGVDKCINELPDLVLMDLRMPVMSGYEATDLLRHHEQTKDIPIVAFTASSMAHDDAKIKSLFDDYVRKPIGRNDLVDMLTQHLPFEVIGMPDTKQPADIPKQSISNEQIQGFKQAFDERNLQQKLDQLLIFMDIELLDGFLNEMEFITRQFALMEMIDLIQLLKKDQQNFDFESYHHHLNQLVNNMKMM